jgi:dihydroorotate dehydrogenase
MAIEFNGYRISNVVISTSLGHFGNGLPHYRIYPSHRRIVRLAKETNTTTLAKSGTRYRKIGYFRDLNPFTWKYVQPIPDTMTGMLNSYGLTNDGVETIAPMIGKQNRLGRKVISNFYPEFARDVNQTLYKAGEETFEAIAIYRDHDPTFRAIELNYSCPNSKEKIRENMYQSARCTELVKEGHPELFLIAKISIVHPYELAEELARVGVDAIHAINTIPYDMVYPGQISPLAEVGGGGISGGPAKKMALDYNRGLAKRVKVPLILGCGVETLKDVKRYQDIGASVVSICSAVIRTPKEVEKIIIAENT